MDYGELIFRFLFFSRIKEEDALFEDFNSFF